MVGNCWNLKGGGVAVNRKPSNFRGQRLMLLGLFGWFAWFLLVGWLVCLVWFGLVGEIHIFGGFDLGRMFAVGYVSMDTSKNGLCFEEILEASIP